MKIWLITLPLLCVAGAAMAQETGPAGADAAQAQEQLQDKAQVQAQVRDQKAKAKPRQGADMRHCLDKKDSKAIIRCAEPGRKR